jgi:hypothetical protein
MPIATTARSSFLVRDNALYAFDLHTGRALLRHAFSPPTATASGIVLPVDDTSVLAVDPGARTVALYRDAAAPAWTASVPVRVEVTTSVDGLVLVAGGGHLGYSCGGE